MPDSPPSSPTTDIAAPFLRLCLLSHADKAAGKAAYDLIKQSRFDWDQVVQLANQERLSSLIYPLIKNWPETPEWVSEALQERYLYESQRNLFLNHELQNIVAILDRASLKPILLKGAALSQGVYEDNVVRPMGDIDLLIRQDQAPAAIKALASACYQQGIEPFTGAALLYENEIVFSKQGAAEDFLEIHWGLFDSPYYQNNLPLDWFWESSKPVEIGTESNRPAWILGPEAFLLHLSGHLMLHHAHEVRLLWLYDIFEVIHRFRHDLDWDLLLDKAQDFDLVLPLQAVLPQVVEAFGAAIPEDVLAQCQELQPTPDETRVYAWHTAADRPVAQRIWSDMAGMKRWSHKLRYALARLFPSPAYMLVRYQIPHKVYLPLFYVKHILTGFFSGLRLFLNR